MAVGDFVKAKYNVDREAAEIELDPKEITFKGRITGFSEASLDLFVKTPRQPGARWG